MGPSVTWRKLCGWPAATDTSSLTRRQSKGCAVPDIGERRARIHPAMPSAIVVEQQAT